MPATVSVRGSRLRPEVSPRIRAKPTVQVKKKASSRSLSRLGHGWPPSSDDVWGKVTPQVHGAGQRPVLEITLNLEKENLNLEINLNDGGVLSGLDVLREYQYW